jgi:hypothetical protein
MTEFATYPMALYPPKGDMLIVENEQQHLDALASWEPAAVEAVAEAVEADDEPETFDDAGVPIKRGPGRPRKVIP